MAQGMKEYIEDVREEGRTTKVTANPSLRMRESGRVQEVGTSIGEREDVLGEGKRRRTR